MRSLIASAWMAVVFVGLIAAGTVAQAGSLGQLAGKNLNAAFQWGYGSNSNAPNGSYQSSCQNINMNGSQLQARCQRADGGWNNSVIDLRSCGGGDIANDNGNLRCSNNGGWQGNQVGTYGNGYPGGNSQANVPQGDYLQSCQNAHMDGSRLEARCQDTNGRWRHSSVDMNQCGNSNISNNNGQLQCGNYTGGQGGYANQTGGWQGGYGNQTGNWQGSYGDFTQSCRNIQYRGDEVRANCQRRNGSWNNTELDDYRSCRGQIVNDDGNLRCNQ